MSSQNKDHTLSDTCEIDGFERAVTASDVSLANFGGQARNFLVLLAMFGGLTKIFHCRFGCSVNCFSLIYLIFGRCVSVQYDRVFGGLAVGPEGHAVLPLHPAHVVSLLVYRLTTKRRAFWCTASTVVNTRRISSWSIVYLSLRREVRDNELSHLPCFCIVRPLAYRGTPQCVSSDMN